MVAIPLDHGPGILKTGRTPTGLFADVLPTGNLLENQETQLITGREKAAILRIVAGSYQIHSQLLEQPCILPLQAWWCSIPEVRIVLVAVQADQLQLAAVEIKAIGPELGRPAAETDHPLILVGKLDVHRIQIGIVQAPAPEFQLFEGQGKRAFFDGGFRPGQQGPSVIQQGCHPKGITIDRPSLQLDRGIGFAAHRQECQMFLFGDNQGNQAIDATK